MDQPVEDGVGEGVIADGGIPLVDGQLAGYQGGGGLVAVVHEVHEVVALCGVEGFHAPVIEDEQSGVGKLAQEFVVAAVGLGLGECQEQAGHTVVAGSVPVPAGLVAEGAGDEGFAGAAGAGDKQVMGPLQPLALCELGELCALQVSGVFIIDVLEAGAQFEARLVDEAVLFALCPLQAFGLDQEGVSLPV